MAKKSYNFFVNKRIKGIDNFHPIKQLIHKLDLGECKSESNVAHLLDTYCTFWL